MSTTITRKSRHYGRGRRAPYFLGAGSRRKPFTAADRCNYHGEYDALDQARVNVLEFDGVQCLPGVLD